MSLNVKWDKHLPSMSALDKLASNYPIGNNGFIYRGIESGGEDTLSWVKEATREL